MTAELLDRRLYGAAIDGVLAREDYVGDILFKVRDYVGSVRKLGKGADASVRARYALDAFGTVREEAKSGAGPGSATRRLNRS
jgi:hypothetical protein